MNLNRIYAKEKKINSFFKVKYDYNNEKIFYKQVLELLCELSEFAYETKCFKYWKNEKQSPAEVTISEFADAIMITLCFCNLANIEEIKIEKIEEKDMVKMFIETHKIASRITMDLDKADLLKILSYLISISKLLGYNEEELEFYCLNKMDKTLQMITGKEA